jgi:hypothetical protein
MNTYHVTVQAWIEGNGGIPHVGPIAPIGPTPAPIVIASDTIQNAAAAAWPQICLWAGGPQIRPFVEGHKFIWVSVTSSLVAMQSNVPPGYPDPFPPLFPDLVNGQLSDYTTLPQQLWDTDLPPAGYVPPESIP